MKTSLRILILLFITNVSFGQQLHVEGDMKVETIQQSNNSAKVLMHENDQTVTHLPISDFDTDNENELQLLSINGDTIFISDGNYIVLPGLSFLSTLIPATVQTRLDNGETPCEIVNSGISIDSMYGKTYSGGLIFHLDLTSCESLIALSIDLNAEQWGCQGDDLVGANGQQIGDGYDNTVSIVSNCTESTYAAKTSWNLNNGLDDWYLPSRLELKEIYNKLHTQNFGSYTSAAHWSSSQSTSNSNKAWTIYFENGNSNEFRDKSIEALFIPIRKQ